MWVIDNDRNKLWLGPDFVHSSEYNRLCVNLLLDPIFEFKYNANVKYLITISPGLDGPLLRNSYDF